MVFVDPMPSDAALEQYNASYFSTAHGGQPRNIGAKAFSSGIARLRIAHIERYLRVQNIVVSSLLELGPGPGFLARNWLENYPATTYLASETDTSCHAPLQKLGVHLVDVFSMAADTAPVDLVVMSHVLEHVSSPIKFLKDATRSLREGGVLFIEVPCRDYEHKPIDEPHLLFFDKGPLRHLLHQSGFENIQVSYHGVTIDQLRSWSVSRAIFMAFRARLIALGLVAPFARVRPGMEALGDPIERAAIAPFEAHCESPNPAWWLRAVATKQ
jgi:SAM-dependent methyltransferase